jgi:hypothetical protein
MAIKPQWGLPSLLLAAAAACTDAAAQADGPTAAPPDPPVGELLTYRIVELFTKAEKSRYAMEFVRREGPMMVYLITDPLTKRTRVVRRTADLGICTKSKDIPTEKCGGAYKFPLKVGQRQGFERRPKNNYWGFDSEDCRVEAFEKLSVPAGTFDTFRVECNGLWRSNFGERVMAFEGGLKDIHWYAPSLNAEIKVIIQVFSKSLVSQEMHELVSIQTAAEHAAEAAAAPPPPRPGEFTLGDTHLSGAFTRDPDGKTYSGNGRVSWVGGDVYEGEMVRGAREGTGRFTWAGGMRYEGQWHADHPQGSGKIWLANGDVYEGAVEAGAPMGPGTMTYASGDHYSGEFFQGVPHGVGTYVWKSGDSYAGSWEKGQRHGQGTQSWANGDRWEGIFVRDQQGEGTLTRQPR